MKRKNAIIMGAAGRDYWNFFAYFKDNPTYEVVCFTQAQIPDIEKRSFPKALAGRLYKKDIPFFPEERLPELIKKYDVDDVFLSYSDLSHQDVMEKASLVLAAGANFSLLGPKDTQPPAKVPVIAITAVRTGAGKSQTSRAIAKILRSCGKKVVGIRHGMPYAKDLSKQTCQRFASERDFKRHDTTIEEEEEYQPWIDNGFVVYSGFDYKEIIKEAEREAEVIIYDGGNNDLPLIKPDLHIVVADPLRPGHEISYYPGFVNLLMADVIVINKVNTAKKEDIQKVLENCKKYNPKAEIILAKSEINVDKPELIKNKLVAVTGDGPSLTHGGMSFGAGTLAALKYKGRIVDPRKYAAGSIKEAYKKYPHLQKEIPAMGYSHQQIRELEQTINRKPTDVIVVLTQANLKRILKTIKPIFDVGF